MFPHGSGVKYSFNKMPDGRGALGWISVCGGLPLSDKALRKGEDSRLDKLCVMLWERA